MKDREPKQHNNWRNKFLPLASVGMAAGLALSSCGPSKDATPTAQAGNLDQQDVKQNVVNNINGMPSQQYYEGLIAAEVARLLPTPEPSATPMAIPDISVEKGDSATGEISGFTPDNLFISTNILPLDITGNDLVTYRNFHNSLETAQADGTAPLLDYMYGKNDFGDTPDHIVSTQFPAYAITVLTGEEVRVDGIGHLKGTNEEAVMLIIINTEPTVEQHDYTFIKNGFLGTARILSDLPATLPNEQQTLATIEKGAVAHWTGSLLFGEATSNFTGQCDNGDSNCSSVLVVTVERHQTGISTNGTPQFKDNLIRAQRISEN